MLQLTSNNKGLGDIDMNILYMPAFIVLSYAQDELCWIWKVNVWLYDHSCAIRTMQ